MEEPKSRWKSYDITPVRGHFNAFYFALLRTNYKHQWISEEPGVKIR
jgi:hypothetical protein